MRQVTSAAAAGVRDAVASSVQPAGDVAMSHANAAPAIEEEEDDDESYNLDSL